MSATSGHSWQEPLAHYDPRTSCWRMSGGMFPSDSMPSLPTLPDWGMTQGGELFALPTPALPTVGLECSSLLPTPNASVSQDGERFETWEVRRQVALTKGYNGNGIGMPLTIAVQLLPTPVADHSRGLAQPGTDYASLPNAVLSLLPTPKASPGGPDNSGTRLSGAKGTRNLSGVITLPPSPGGKPSSAEPSPDLLRMDATGSD